MGSAKKGGLASGAQRAQNWYTRPPSDVYDTFPYLNEDVGGLCEKMSKISSHISIILTTSVTSINVKQVFRQTRKLQPRKQTNLKINL